MARLGTHWSGIAAVLRSTNARIFTVIGLGFSGLGVVTDGFSYWTWFQKNAAWVGEWPRHGWFYWAVAALLLLFLWRAGGSVAAEQRAAQVRAEAAARELLALPLLLVRYQGLSSEISTLSKDVGTIEATIAQYRIRTERWLGDESFVVDPALSEEKLNLTDIENLTRNRRFLNFNPPEFQRKTNEISAHISSTWIPGLELDRRREYKPENNVDFKQSLRRFRSELESYVLILREFESDQIVRLAAIDRAISDKGAQNG